MSRKIVISVNAYIGLAGKLVPREGAMVNSDLIV